ncbi:hypothetical protein F4782DRAFT_552739 [Xylaria castorea]|nr:hypothetical protein F4782DRAFT_552739 [Xylaria castorea]
MPPYRRRHHKCHRSRIYPRRTATWVYKLREIVPKSGMKYLDANRVMHGSRRDKQVCDALKNTGYELSAAGLRRAFVPMFQMATPVFIDARAKGEDLWDMFATVQHQLDWACLLGESVFFELFTRLIESRYLWEEKPVSPFFEYHHYASVVVELVKFRKAVGDCPQDDSLEGPNYQSWILADAEVYNVLAGGIEENGDTGIIQPDERDDLIPPMQKMAIDKPEQDSSSMQLDN